MENLDDWTVDGVPRPTDLELADACRTAAKELRQHPNRWCQSMFFDAGIDELPVGAEYAGAACALGHVLLALYPEDKLEDLVAAGVPGALMGQMPGTVRFNDQNDRRVEQVIGYLEERAEHHWARGMEDRPGGA